MKDCWLGAGSGHTSEPLSPALQVPLCPIPATTLKPTSLKGLLVTSKSPATRAFLPFPHADDIRDG